MSGEKSRILLVGESPSTLESSARSLLSEFEALTAKDGAQAIERLKGDGPFAAVVCDPEALLSAIQGALPSDGGEPSSMSALYRFCVALNAAEDLPAIARLAARATFDCLAGRGVHVQLWDDDAPCGVVEAAEGGEMSVDMHCEPLLSPAGKVGEIVVDLAGHALDAHEANVLTLIAVPAAACVRTELRRRERDAAQRATILAMARLAERRDNETGKHLLRVSLYCELIARGLRDNGDYVDEITDDFIEDLVRSAPLHDIGKVGIPDAVLLKPGKLDEREWALMQTHAELGALVLDEVIGSLKNPVFLAMGREIALCHHEKWDGSGYPAGLAGQEIPLSARILAVADIYDALTSARPYKSPWTHEASIEHMQGLGSTHLDARVLQAFVAHLPEVDSIRARLADEPEDMAALYEQLTTGTS